MDGQSIITNTDAANVKYSYYPNGQIKTVTYPPLTDGSVLSTEYLYNKLNQVSSVTNKKGTTVLSLFSYTYDNNGNIDTLSQTVNNQGPRTNQYWYDKLNRLTTITRWDGSNASYTYDLKGNRLTLQDTGGFISSSDVSYQYDLLNTLTSATVGSTTVSFEYGTDGMRLRKSSGSNVMQYRYNQVGEVISEVNGSNQPTANYVRGDRLLVKKDVTAEKDYYYLYNGHGDVIQIVDTAGNVVNSYNYDEWGNITEKNEQISNSFKYAGEMYDDETGLYYLRARYYDPGMGRFINEDTYEGQIDNPLSLNLYTYTHNNPLIYSDPTGHNIKAQYSAGGSAPVGGYSSGGGGGGRVSLPSNIKRPPQQSKPVVVTKVNSAKSDIVETRRSIAAFRATQADVVETRRTALAPQSAGKVYSPSNPHPTLSESVQNSFSGGTFTEKVLTQDTTFYRVYGGDAGKVGSYMTRTPQNGGLQSQTDLALNPAWGNTTTSVTKVVVPKGTVIYEGTAAPQNISGGGTLLGGGNQIYIPKVDTSWFGK